MIVEIAFGIVLACIILAYLREILALGVIVIAVGFVIVGIAIAAFLVYKYPEFQGVLLTASGIAAVWAIFHFRKDTNKKSPQAAPVLAWPEPAADEFEANHRMELEKIAALKRDVLAEQSRKSD